MNKLSSSKAYRTTSDLVVYVKRLQSFTIILSVLMFLIYSPVNVAAQSEATITGEIKKTDGQSPGVIPVRLMEITMSDQPSIRPLQTIQTLKDGSYKFTVLPNQDPTARVFYRISVDLNGQAIGSEPFRAEQGGPPIHINLTLPDVIYGREHLAFPKEILIFENLQEFVCVTGILYVVNSTGALVNAKKIPFKRPLPASAINFKNLGNQKNLDIRFEKGELVIGITLADGTQEVFYSYDLPVVNQDLAVDYLPIPGMQEVEFTTPDEATTIEIDKKVLQSSNVVMKQKQAGGRLFRSKIVSLGEDVDRISIVIKGIPMNQSKLFYPAVFLLVILLAGLVFYLLRSPKSPGQ